MYELRKLCTGVHGNESEDLMITREELYAHAIKTIVKQKDEIEAAGQRRMSDG